MIMKKMLLLLLLLTACGENGTDESIAYSGKKTEPPPEDAIVTFAILKEKVLTPGRCMTCHGDGGTRVWSGNDEEEKVLSQISGDSYEESPLYDRSADGSMPPGGPAVDDNGLAYIRKFIEGLDTD